MMKRNQKGITLIALVITIVIMLTLAGVTLNITLGENGLFKMATQSVDKYKEASEEEKRQTARFNAIINNETYKYTAKDGKTVPIPAGFAPTQIDGEDSVNDGLVIVDSEGNEFVWVPCESGEYKKHTYEVNLVDDSSSNTSDGTSEDKGWNTYDYRKYSDWKDNEINEKANKKSVEDNKGFYIARYEAGVPKGADFYVEPSAEGVKTYQENKNNINKNIKPVSKKGVQAWNLISQTNAKEVSGRIYSEETYGVRSQLIDGTAWDTVVEWIAKDSRYENIVKDSTNYGNYINTPQRNIVGLYAVHPTTGLAQTYTYGTGSIGGEESLGINRIEMATGLVDAFKLKNIYDIAGNMQEWTTEFGYHDQSNSKKYAVARGGCARDKGGIDYDGAVSVRNRNARCE